jgi:hypothetical protein
MAKNTKERSETIQARALEIVKLAEDGRCLNSHESIAQLMKELGCTKETARRHVARASRRQRHPDYQPPQWGGKRPGAGRPFEYVIDVVNGRCIVSRRVDGQWGLLSYSAAINWHELEEAAATAVAQQGGAINISGQYPCPAELVETAVWDKADD